MTSPVAVFWSQEHLYRTYVMAEQVVTSHEHEHQTKYVGFDLSCFLLLCNNIDEFLNKFRKHPEMGTPAFFFFKQIFVVSKRWWQSWYSFVRNVWARNLRQTREKSSTTHRAYQIQRKVLIIVGCHRLVREGDGSVACSWRELEWLRRLKHRMAGIERCDSETRNQPVKFILRKIKWLAVVPFGSDYHSTKTTMHWKFHLQHGHRETTL